jgi:hypothetical protein
MTYCNDYTEYAQISGIYTCLLHIIRAYICMYLNHNIREIHFLGYTLRLL